MRGFSARLPGNASEAVAVALAVASVLLRAPRNLTREAAESPLDILAVAVATVDAATVAPVLVDGVTLLLIAVNAWLVVPTIYPSAWAPERLGFRIIASGLTLWWVRLTSQLRAETVSGTGFQPVVAWIGVAVVVIVGYHAATTELLDPEGQYLQPTAFLVARGGGDPSLPTYREDRARLAERPVLWVVYIGIAVLGSAILYATPAFFPGSIIGLINSTYPLFEVLAVIYVSGRVYTRERRGPDRTPVDELGVFESNIYTSVRRSVETGGFKGMVSVLICLFGLLISTGTAITVIPATAVLDAIPPTTQAGYLMLISGVIVGAYGSWYWYRQLRRLPAFLSAWQLTMTELDSFGDFLQLELNQGSPGPTTRPIDYGATASLLFATAVFLAVVYVQQGPALPFVALVAWGCFAAALITAIFVTLNRESQAALSDEIALPGAIVIQGLVSIVVFGRLFGRPEIQLLGNFITAIFLPTAFLLPSLAAGVTDNTADSDTDADKGAPWLGPSVFGILGVLGAVLWTVVDVVGWFFLLVAVMGIGGTTVEAIYWLIVRNE